MATLGLNERHVFAGRRIMVPGCIRLRGFDRANAVRGGIRNAHAVANTMLAGARRTQAMVGAMVGGACRTGAMVGAMLGGACRTGAMVGAILCGARYAGIVANAVISSFCTAADPMIRNGCRGCVMRCHVHRHVHVFGG